MIDPDTLDLPGFWAALEAGGLPRRLLELARDEDLGEVGDLTASVMRSATRQATAAVRARGAGVVAGVAALPLLADVFGATIMIEPAARDGSRIDPGETVATLRGDLAQIVTIERTVLNLLGRMCGVATRTAEFVERVAGTGAAILDTRKTTPGLRVFEKYAVRCGGGRSHRLGLHDAVLIKDNHLAHVRSEDLAGALEQAAREARSRRALFVEVEVDTLAQFEEALRVPAGLIDIVLLDNMTPDQLRRAVAFRDRAGSDVRLEASGGVRLDTVRAIAETGVDRISVGALTHSAVSLDLGLDID